MHIDLTIKQQAKLFSMLEQHGTLFQESSGKVSQMERLPHINQHRKSKANLGKTVSSPTQETLMKSFLFNAYAHTINVTEHKLHSM